MDRQSLLWTLIVFFGASVAFRGIQDATRGEPLWVTLAIEIAALVVIVAGITLFVRRRR